MTYKNTFYIPKNQNALPEYPADPNAIAYKGYTIHKRSSVEYHVVKDGECWAMTSTVFGAKQRIDKNKFDTYYLKKKLLNATHKNSKHP